MESFFLGETLKYFFLLFSDRKIVSFDHVGREVGGRGGEGGRKREEEEGKGVERQTGRQTDTHTHD